MQSPIAIETIIAQDKKELSSFILNLCGFTLDQAGYNSKDYAFFLHVAFRHQAILQSEEWEKINAAILIQPLNWQSKNNKLLRRIEKFSQAIVTEIVEAGQDNITLKLLKTSYFSTLDKARKSSEEAIQKINVQDGQNYADLQVSTIFSQDHTIESFTQLLRANRSFLDSLLGLPFILEKLCVSIAKTEINCNYQPNKTAEMLAKTLDTISSALGNENPNFLINGLKLAIKITLPDIQLVDNQLIEMITKDLLPFVDNLIKAARDLEIKKAKVFPATLNDLDAQQNLARQKILATMDVNLYSIKDLLQETLLNPVQQFNQALGSAAGLSIATYNALLLDNNIDQALQIKETFEHFDKLAHLCSEVDQSLLPNWLSQANSYYQQLKNGVNAVGQLALNGLGAFYNCPGMFNQLALFIPQSIRYYLSHGDNLSKVFNLIDNNTQSIPSDRILAYFAFYELIAQAKISESELKSQFFAIYMAEVVKADPKLNLASFRFQDYLKLEKQLDTKFDFLSLSGRFEEYALRTKSDFSESFIGASEVLGISNPKILDALVLINQIQTLEGEFDSLNPHIIFTELGKTFNSLSQARLAENPEIQAISKFFLQPAMQRLLLQYQNESLVPLTEGLLEKTNGLSHRLALIYSKLKEEISLTPEDLDQIKEAYVKQIKGINNQQSGLKNNIFSAKNIAALISVNIKPSPKEWKTPNQILKEKAVQTLENIGPSLITMLKILRSNLDNQRTRLVPIAKIELARKKINYIDSLNNLINNLIDELKNPDIKKYSELQTYIISLLNGRELVLTQQELQDKTSLTALPGKLLDSAINELPMISPTSIPAKLLAFAWNALPVSPQNTIFYNVLEYALRDHNTLHELLTAESKYKLCLNSEPIPALINELSDPLSAVNLLPSQEKIMDAIVTNLVDAAKQKTYAWGVNYLKEFLVDISYEQFIRFLPYPFLAELAIKAIQSETVQKKVAPIFNSLVNEYGGMVAEEFKKVVKSGLYPVLGIEIKKTIESCAYAYAKNPDASSETDRDSFAMYYLQYQEIKQKVITFNNEDAIRYIFPHLLMDLNLDERKPIIDKIMAQFVQLDKLELFTAESNEGDKFDQQLQFLIENFDFNDTLHLKLIKLALINRLVMTTLETAEQLSDAEKIASLQIQAIHHLGKTLIKINDFSKQARNIDKQKFDDLDFGESFLLMPMVNEEVQMQDTIAAARKRALKQQLHRVKNSVADNQKLLKAEQNRLKEMKRISEDPLSGPFLGVSLLEWEYHQSSIERKIFIFIAKLAAIIGPISSWLGIIAAIVSSQGILQVLGLALGWTGIGFAISAGISLIINFIIKIVEHLPEIKGISLEKTSIWRRTWQIALVIMKSFGLALAKTLFINLIWDVLIPFFFADPLQEIRDSARYWPDVERVDSEIECLANLQTTLKSLDELISMQIQYLEKKIDPLTDNAYLDQSNKIGLLLGSTCNQLEDVKSLLTNVSSNDARFKVNAYQEVLNNLFGQFTKLTNEATQLHELQIAEVNFNNDRRTDAQVELKKHLAIVEAVPENSEPAIKLIPVSLKAYRAQLKKQPGYLSYFWNLFAAKPTAQDGSEKALEALENSLYFSNSNVFFQSQSQLPDHERVVEKGLTMSSFFMVESILEGISIATPENDNNGKEIEPPNPISYQTRFYSYWFKENKNSVSEIGNEAENENQINESIEPS
ncbi:MAG: hypothetical protein H0U70_11450 [Tatlockia sp.]|nr:hypothetical protein [Tatlockia sp.]